MFKVFSTTTLFCFCVWIIPLGAFIKPSQEKTACGGHRAFHMCSMMTGKTQTESSGKIGLNKASGAERQAKSSASAGDDFLLTNKKKKQLNRIESRCTEENFFPYSFFPENPHYPPRMALSF